MATTNTKSDEPTAADLAAQKKADAEKSAPAKTKVTSEKGDLKVAVNLIVQTGADGKPEDVIPGQTFYPAKVDVDFLVRHEAVREPTDAERLMHEHVAKQQASASVDADETLG